MEEFYRRKYGSNVPFSYIPHSSSVSQLREQLKTTRQHQQQLGQLQLQIFQLQKQNRKMLIQKQQIESQYLQKVKLSKQKIKNLKINIRCQLDDNEKIDKSIDYSRKLLGQKNVQLDEIKQKLIKIKNQKDYIVVRLKQQEKVSQSLIQKLQEKKVNNQSIRVTNDQWSRQLQERYQHLQQEQQQLDLQNVKYLKKQEYFNELKQKKQQLLKKIKAANLEVVSLQNTINFGQKQRQRNQKIVKDLQKYNEKQRQLRLMSQLQAKQYIQKTNKNVKGLKCRVDNLLQGLKCAAKSNSYLQSLIVREQQTKNKRLQLQQYLKSLCDTYGEQQQNYTKIVEKMKHSIIQDQKAIQNLSRQAQQLQNIMI